MRRNGLCVDGCMKHKRNKQDVCVFSALELGAYVR